MNDNQKRWFAKVPKIYQQNYKTAISGRSRAAAIKAKCLDCANFQRVEIANCPIEDCALWLYRPYRSPENLKTPRKTGTLENETVKG